MGEFTFPIIKILSHFFAQKILQICCYFCVQLVRVVARIVFLTYFALAFPSSIHHLSFLLLHLHRWKKLFTPQRIIVKLYRFSICFLYFLLYNLVLVHKIHSWCAWR